MNADPSSSPTAPTRNGPTRWARRPPTAPNTTSGRANSVMPRLAIHSAVSRSSRATDHSASNEPIITHTAQPISRAPAKGRRRSRSNAMRWDASGGPRPSTIRRELRTTNGRATTVAPAMTRNGTGMPNGPTSMAATAGPAAKPPTSAASRRPRLCPMRSGSATMTMRRTAGTAMPTPMPITKRPTSSGTNDRARGQQQQPDDVDGDAGRARGARAWPRSASGAISTWARNPAKKPIPMTAPSALSLTPYSSRMSSSMLNSAP